MKVTRISLQTMLRTIMSGDQPLTRSTANSSFKGISGLPPLAEWRAFIFSASRGLILFYQAEGNGIFALHFPEASLKTFLHIATEGGLRLPNGWPVSRIEHVGTTTAHIVVTELNTSHPKMYENAEWLPDGLFTRSQ